MNDATEDALSALKKNKIEHVHLPQWGVTPKLAEADQEAFGGSGKVPSVPVDAWKLRQGVIDALRQVYDPEIPVNVYDLGLIYHIDIDEQGRVEIEMTLTAPACPVAGMLVKQVADAAGDVEGVSLSHVELVWDPPWSQDRMTEAAKLELGLL